MINLSGTWQLRDETGDYDLKMDVPGDVHTALLAAGHIPDPFVGRNEVDIQWVGRRTWVLQRGFQVSESDLAAGERFLLEIDSFDSVGEVLVNGTSVVRSTSMFVPLRADVGHALRTGENRIEVRLHSAEAEAAARASRLPYPVPHQIYPQQSMHRNLLRKAQCHGSWDWGIAMMVSGLYGRISIRPVPAAAIRAAWGVPRRAQGETWRVPIHIEWDAPGLEPGDCGYPDAPAVEALILDSAGRQVAASDADTVLAAPEAGVLTLELTVDAPALWWPAGYGAQPLYTVVVRLGEDERRFTTAFRTIDLVNRKDDVGASFYFRVNGRDLWAKGANWIPVDAFPSRQTADRYRGLLQDARDANMNMIRVWGGGQYEPEVFYDICDELGLLVWQDFMFSCSTYPTDEVFLGEVRAEVRAQLRRLISHPSIALWCGNNENIGALGWFEETRNNPGRYLIDFDRLNNGVVGREVRATDDTRVFWPSSPAAGEADFSDNWHDDSSGDMHYWSVWHEGKAFSAYYDVVPRFCSEFGFQSFPSLRSLRSFATEDQLNPSSPVMEHHQRHQRGNVVVVETLSRYFRFPFDFKDFVYLSQVQQAMAISMAVRFWRSRRPVAMGALYWQLNDLWPVVSWSSIEYDGTWKLLHYEARRFFAPVRPAVFVHDGNVEVHIFNDTGSRIAGKVLLQVLNFSGVEIHRTSLTGTCPADASVALWRTPVSQLPVSPTEGFVVVSLDDPALRDYTLLAEFKEVELQRPRIEVREAGGAIDITVHDAPAFWLTLEPAATAAGGEAAGGAPTSAANFSDNGVFMLPGETMRFELPEGTMVGSIRTIADAAIASKSAGPVSR